MSSSKHDYELPKSKTVSNLTQLFNAKCSEKNESNKFHRSLSHGHIPKKKTRTDKMILEQEVIHTTFEKHAGRIKDFVFYHGQNSRGITGLFIRKVRRNSVLSGVLEPGDQLVKVNCEDIKNSEASSVNDILNGLSGNVTLEVTRFKNLEGNTRQVGSRSFSDSNLPSKQIVSRSVSTDMPTSHHSSVRTNELELYPRITSKNRSPEVLKEEYKIIERNQAASRFDEDLVEVADEKPVNNEAKMDHQGNKEERVVKKSVDSIEDWEDILQLLKVLNIKTLKKDDMNVLKSKINEQIKEQNSGEVAEFSAISRARKDDMQKRRTLEHYYSSVEECLVEIDDNLTSMVSTFYNNRDVRKVLDEQRDRLGKEDYNLLVAGETSAGKSSLINLILGEEALPYHALSTTSTICEVKYGEVRKLVLHKKHDTDQEVKPPTESLELKIETECGKSYQDQILPYVSVDRTRTQTQSETEFQYEKVELFWPHDFLQGGTVIIDSPGFGESDEMDEILMNYLPNAFGFIYVLDVSNAGGMNKNIREKFRQMLGKIESIDGRTEKGSRLTECSLYVCNKWDQIEKKERDKVKEYVFQQLSECWENANLNKQIVYISAKDAKTAQEYGGVTPEYHELLQKLKHAILRAIEKRLYDHWKWLDEMLYHIGKSAYEYRIEVQMSDKEIRERIVHIETRTTQIEEKQEKVLNEMLADLKQKTKYLSVKMYEYISSSQFEKTFCQWKDSSPPPKGNAWEITKSNIDKGIEYKFEGLLIQWERENRIYSEIHSYLMDEFLTSLNLIEDEFKDIESTVHGEQIHNHYDSRKPPAMSKQAKVVIGVTSPIWLPVGLVIGMPVLGAIALGKKVSKKMNLDKYAEDPRSFLEKQSRDFLASLTQDTVLQYAEKQMEKSKNILSKYASFIPILIQANRKMVSHLKNDTRNHDEILKLYEPIESKAHEIQRKMTPLGIELQPAAVDSCDLEWKNDSLSYLGEGDFSRVFKGKLRNDGRKKRLPPDARLDVAVKLFKQPFDFFNQRLYLHIEGTMRHMDHKNVAKFFGAVNKNTSHQSKEHKFAFLTEFCQANLRSIVFKNESNYTPAKASKTNEAINTFLKWAMEIADGLNYIHMTGLVHKHLKLDNILVDSEGVAKIADIGIVGRIVETEQSIIYLAPEVLADLEVRKKEADIYSYGVMLWEMWYGIQAFTELKPLVKATFQETIANGYRPKTDKRKVAYPEVHEIIAQCWSSDIDKRHSAKTCQERFEDLLQHRGVSTSA